MSNEASAGPIILIIEDVASEAMTLEAMCRHFGYDAVRAGNPQEAGTILDVIRPAAIVTDLVMPGTDGLDALFMLATRAPDVPVMITTSSEWLLLKAAVELSDHFGVRNLACAAKPVSAGALKAFLRRAPQSSLLIGADAK
jgi:CheY-like chemotaxis protein